MSGDAFQCPDNVLAGLADAATGNVAAAGNSFAAAGDQAGDRNRSRR